MQIDHSQFFDAPLPDNVRGFFDPEKTRKWLQENTIKGFEQYLSKVETPNFKLRVKNVHFENPDKHFSLKEQQNALQEKHDLTMPVKGTVELIDKRTNQVTEAKTLTLAHVPWVTDRNTVVYNGTEYSTTNQQRLKPGVYTRIRDTGEAEAHVNVQAGTGTGGKMIFYPDKALFVYQVGTTKIKLYGLLKDLGVSDSQMEEAWGKEIFAKNKQAYEGTEIDKMYDKIFNY